MQLPAQARWNFNWERWKNYVEKRSHYYFRSVNKYTNQVRS